MYCMYCGNKAENNEKHCIKCGAPIGISEKNLPLELMPMSAWSYFGHSILFNIPIAGVIILIVFACGGTRNVNKRSFARSYFCWLAIVGIGFIIMAALGVSITEML